MLSNRNTFPSPRRARAFVAGLLLVPLLAVSGCGDDAPAADTPTASVSDVTGVTLIRADGEQVVRVQVLNPTEESSSYTVTVAIASSKGTQIASATVPIADVPAGKKKSGTSEPLSPPVPVRSQLIVTGIERTVP